MKDGSDVFPARRHRHAAAIALAVATAAMALPAAAQSYDVVIANGRVMDPETGFDGIRNVGISGGTIVAITEDAITGTETIDATGHVVAPGFIEGHFHATDPFGRKVALRDGLTTQMDFEAGVRDVAKFYADSEGKTQSNYGMVLNAGLARLSVLDGMDVAEKGNTPGDMFSFMVNDAGAKALAENRKPGWSNTLADREELTRILTLVDEGLRQGALGVGIPVGYMTTGLTQYEMFKYQELATRYGRIANAHTRFAGIRPPTGGMLGIQEMLANALVLDAPFMAAHLNSVMDWEYTIPLINRARENGAKVWGEVYPYAAASTIAQTDIVLESNFANMGITYSDISDLDGTRWDKQRYDDTRTNRPGSSIVIYNNREEDIGTWLAMPGVVIVSDGMPPLDENGDYFPWSEPYEGKSIHPRGAGTRATVLRMVREDNIMPLMEAISKMSYLHAKYFEELGGIPHFATKGRIQVGADADIVVFDPDTVTDNSTYQLGEGTLPSTGIPCVLVNGVVVVKDSVVQEVFPGQPIRFPIQATGRLDGMDISPRDFDPRQGG